jgi:hypothetical protein
MALAALAVYDLAEGVLACVCAALEEAEAEVEGAQGCPCRASVVPGGTVAWDGCADPCGDECGGMLAVGVSRMYLSDTFPIPSQAVQGSKNCVTTPYTAVELVITLLRCSPVGDDMGNPPEPTELAEAARVMMIDSAVVLDALQCCLPGLAPPGGKLLYTIGAFRSLGPEGGCAGGEWRVTIALTTCRCPETGVVPGVTA